MDTERARSFIYLGPLSGVKFPTRRQTVGQAGRDVAGYCQAIIKEAGSIGKALAPAVELPKYSKVESSGGIAVSSSTLWKNPGVRVGELYPNLAQQLAL